MPSANERHWKLLGAFIDFRSAFYRLAEMDYLQELVYVVTEVERLQIIRPIVSICGGVLRSRYSI